MKVNMEKIMRHPNAEFIIAFAEGKQLQFKNTSVVGSAVWIDFQGEDDLQPEIGPWSSKDFIQWRIKPEQKWVRVAMCEDHTEGWRIFVDSDRDEKEVENRACFSHWLSARLYYTPEDKA